MQTMGGGLICRCQTADLTGWLNSNNISAAQQLLKKTSPVGGVSQVATRLSDLILFRFFTMV